MNFKEKTHTFYYMKYTHIKNKQYRIIRIKKWKSSTISLPTMSLLRNSHHEEFGVYVGEYISPIFIFIIKL